MKAIIALFLTFAWTAEAAKFSHKGKSADTYYNEAPNASRCTVDDECDGRRTCGRTGWCRGIAR